MDIKLYNDDCENILKTIPDKSIDLIVTDPPYEVSIQNGGGSIKEKFVKIRKDLTDVDITKGYDIEKIGKEFLRVCKKPNIYIFCNKVQIPKYFNFYVNENECNFDIISWHKSNPIPSYANKYMTDTEYCLYFRKGGYCVPQNYEDGKTFFIQPINEEDKRMYGHPTIKPLNIINRFIRNSSKEGDTVLDVFMGSGTTGVSAKRLKRNFIGIELSKKYFDIAERRINELSLLDYL